MEGIHPKFILSKRFPVHAAVEQLQLDDLERLLQPISDAKSVYSVMQSDGNSYCGDIICDSFTLQHTGMKIENMKSKYLKIKNTAQNNKELIKFSFSAAVVLACIFVECSKNQNLHNNNPSTFAFIYLV